MITENGIVTQSNDKTAWVKTTRSAACESCSSKDSCGTSHHGSQDMIVTVKNTLCVQAGDNVVIGIETKPMLYLSFLLYVFPVLLLLVGALVGDTLAPLIDMNKSLAAMLLGFFSFAAAFLVVRKKQATLSGNDAYKPFLVRKKSRSAIEGCAIL
ncbi:MAG TPA: Fis family transcriptional regulator [Desulfobacteraceae bacterium]|nr:Fis family transcriptional regulator [Desulfobacteraceae bacterium]|tara:strand:+ start:425 stop:889 length:465 start_codon:yes stop_codon:yes gene_type:complete